MRSPRLVFITAVLLISIFFAFTRERTRHFIGHHDWYTLSWVIPAENYQHYGLLDTRLQQINNPIPVERDDWEVNQHHPPGISVITWLIIETFGNTEFTVRFASILITMLAVALLIAITKRYADFQVALLAAFFFGFSPLIIYFSAINGHENYLLALMLGFILFAQRQKGVVDSFRWHIMLLIIALTGALIGWAWYFFVGVQFLFQWWQKRSIGIKAYAGLWIGTAIGGILVLLIGLWQQADYLATMQDAFLNRTQNQDSDVSLSIGTWFLVMGSRLLWVGTPVVTIFALITGYQSRRQHKHASNLLVLVIAGLGYIIVFWQAAYIHNYLLYYALAPLCVYAAMGFVQMLYAHGRPPKSTWRFVMTLLLVAFLVGSYRWGTALFAHDLNEERYEWGVSARAATARDEVIVSNLPYLGPQIGYYARRTMRYAVDLDKVLNENRPSEWGFYIYCEVIEALPEWLDDYQYSYDSKTECYLIDLQ